MYPIQVPDQLGTYLRALRKTRGLTQGDLSRMLGVSRARVTQIEKDPSNLGFSNLLKILNILGARMSIEPMRGESQRRTRDRSTPHGEW